jgi:ANTAR domain-containing protein/PAS domain-containing protein
MSPTSMNSQPALNGQVRANEVGQFVWDVAADTWWWSDALYRLLGYESDAVTPSLQRFLQHKAPEDVAQVDAVFSRCLDDGGPFSCYHHIVDAHGVRKTVVAVGHGDRDPAGSQTVTITGFIVDVTGSSRQETNVALQATLATRAVIDQVKGVIMLIYGLKADAAFQMLVGHSSIANKKVSAIADALVSALDRRGPVESVSRSEVDRMLRDACLGDTRSPLPAG